MKGKVILELEEYEELIRKNSKHIDTIIEETKKLNEIKKEVKNIIIGRTRLIDGCNEYFIVPNDSKQLFELIKKDLIKNMSIKEFKKLKKNNFLLFV